MRYAAHCVVIARILVSEADQVFNIDFSPGSDVLHVLISIDAFA